MRRSWSPLARASAECWSTHHAQPFSWDARSLTSSRSAGSKSTLLSSASMAR
jgi:hypothetical protein